jgi:hypothetical protein
MLLLHRLLPFLALLGSGGVWAIPPAPSLDLPQAVDWDAAIPTGNPRLALLLSDHATATRLRGLLHAELNPPLSGTPFFSTAPLLRLPPAAALRSLQAAAASLPTLPAVAELDLKWLGEPAIWQKTRLFPVSGRIVSTYRAGTITHIRTFLPAADGSAMFLHLLVDQPGALSFSATLHGPGDRTTLQQRRELARSHGTSETRAWILPFEADVEPAESSILLRGEGEALIILNYGPTSGPNAPAGTLKRLAATHDPGQSHPDPVKLWHAISAAHPDAPSAPSQTP